jgi:colanic acid biosynthesis glycosyl transferase WcaI
MYPDMAVGGDIVRPSKWIDRWEKMHRRALLQAERVIVLGEDMRDRIVSKGIPLEKVVVVRDGAVPAGPMPDARDSVVQEIRCGFPFVVLHAGNVGFYGAWATLLKAAELLLNRGPGLVFVGDGANRAPLQASARRLPNVRFLPFRPVAQVPHVMMAGDLHIVTIRRGLEGVVVPSKLYSILAAGRPVLAVVPKESDAARIVMESGCGMTADPDDPAAVASAISQLQEDPARLLEMGRHAREAAEKYARVHEVSNFVGVVEQVGRKHGEGNHRESQK